jgi:hypothetical protein
MNPTASAPVTGEKLKARGQAKVASAAQEWRDRAIAGLRRWLNVRAMYFGTVPTFTMDEFRDSTTAGMFVGEPPHVNAWGTLPQAAVKAGLIAPTSNYRKATRPEAHARMVKVWAAA